MKLGALLLLSASSTCIGSCSIADTELARVDYEIRNDNDARRMQTTVNGSAAGWRTINNFTYWPDAGHLDWTYSTAEGAAASRQAFNALQSFVSRKLEEQERSGFHSGVILGASRYDLERSSVGSEIGAIFCEIQGPEGQTVFKPNAIVTDILDTVILDLPAKASAAGYKWTPIDTVKGFQTEDGTIAPGALDVFKRLEARGITIVYNSSLPQTMAERLENQLEREGFTRPILGKTLFLGDREIVNLDEQRSKILNQYCVLAVIGNDLSDFWGGFSSEPDERLSQAVDMQAVGWHVTRDNAERWGDGWFLVPSPRYRSNKTKEQD